MANIRPMAKLRLRLLMNASHHLPNHKGHCKKDHGHTWEVIFTMSGTLNDDGMLVDFGDLKPALFKLLPDHDNLNENMPNGVPPTAENLARVFYYQANSLMSQKLWPPIIEVQVWESRDACAIYDADCEIVDKTNT